MEKQQTIELTEIQQQILDCLKFHGALTRNQIVGALTRSGTTIHENLIKLTNMGLIEVYVPLNPKKGRSKHYYRLKTNTKN